MKQDKNKFRRIGGLLLEALMLFFVFTSSWTDVKASHKNLDGALTICTAPTEQIIFRDTDSSESLAQPVVKFQFTDCEFIPAVIDLPNLRLATTEALSVTHSLFNTFYYHVTTNAP